MSPVVLGILFWDAVVSVFVGTVIGNRKGRTAAGFWMAFFLAWIGVIIVACMTPSFEAQVRRERERHAVLAAVNGAGMPVERTATWSAACEACGEPLPPNLALVYWHELRKHRRQR